MKVADPTFSQRQQPAQPRRQRSLPDIILQAILSLLLLLALLALQALIGGTRIIYALPGYGLLAAAGVIGCFALAMRRPAPNGACLFGTSLFCAYIIIRAVASPAPYLARTDIMSVLAGLVVYFLTSSIITNAKARMWIFAGLLMAALAHVVVGIIQFGQGENFMPIPFLQRFDYGHRASGFYICPDHLAGLLEVLGIFGLSIACWSRWPVWGKLLIGYAVAACYFGILITASRGGWVSVVASWLVFAVLSGRLLVALRGSNLIWKVGAAAMLVTLVGIGSAVFFVSRSEILAKRVRTAVPESSFRFDMWQAALKQWQLSPVFGTGSRTYMFYGRLFRTQRMQRDPIYAHGDYLQLLAEYGAVGAIGFVIFLVPHLRHGLVDARRLGPKRILVSPRLTSNAMALNIGALSAVGAYAAHSVVDFNLHIPANVVLMAFVFGIIANAGVIYEPGSPPFTRSLIFGRVMLVLIGLALAWRAWSLAPGEYYGEKARVALRDNGFLSAVDYAEKATATDPTNPEPYYYMARARLLGGDLQDDGEAADSFYEAAVPPLQRAVALAPLDETYPIELALTYDSLERYAEAEWLYWVGMRLDPLSSTLREYYRVHIERWKSSEPLPQD